MSKSQRTLPLSASLPDPIYVFRILTCIGFCTQWVVMILNGSFVAMVLTNWNGVFPTGTAVKTSWTGIWPFDFVLGLLVVFFGAVNNISDLPDVGPFVMLVDLVFALVVFNMMTLIEDRRNRKTGPLRSPAFWQFLWNWCGAASVLPVYAHLYLQKRLVKIPSLPMYQAQALPLTALWSVIISLPLLLPAALGARPFQIQDGVVVWFFGPLLLGPFQDLAAYGLSKLSYQGLHDPVSVTYWIVGSVSAIVHIGIAVWPLFSSSITWARVYWPNHEAVQKDSSSFMTEGAMLFMQYDHVVIYLCVIALGAYVLVYQHESTSQASATWRPVARSLAVLTTITIIAGPGAALAWLLSGREQERSDADVILKVDISTW